MPTYDFKCKQCDEMRENVLLRITHDDLDKPHCCGEPMDYHITQAPMVHWHDPVIEPFRAIATKDAPVITSTKQNREYMARNDLIDANELGPPPSRQEEAETRAEMQASIDAITPDADTASKMEQQGMMDILPE